MNLFDILKKSWSKTQTKLIAIAAPLGATREILAAVEWTGLGKWLSPMMSGKNIVRVILVRGLNAIVVLGLLLSTISLIETMRDQKVLPKPAFYLRLCFVYVMYCFFLYYVITPNFPDIDSFFR